MPAGFQQLSAGRGFVGRLETGSDLVAEIERFCREQGVVAAQVTVIGALRRAAYAYYEQDDHRYLELSSETHHEIVGFTGNISLRDDKPFLHAHATFADDSAHATMAGMTDRKQSQLDKFKEAARELECDDDEQRFKERLDKLVKAKPLKPAGKK